jgi:hypothetical protein
MAIAGAESYGGQSIAWVRVKAGQTVTISLAPPPAKPAPKAPGPPKVPVLVAGKH